MVFYTLAFTLFLIVVPGIPPHYNFEPYMIRPPRKLEGKLTPNDVLDQAELVVEGKFVAPESIAIRGDDAFTGVEGGAIIKVDVKGQWKKVAQIEGNCDGSIKSICPKPLGVRFSKEGKLIVADCHKGLYEIDVDTGSTKALLPTNTTLGDGLPLNMPDDLDIDHNGIIYFSDASLVASFKNTYLEILGPPTGRLIKYDPKTKNTETLLKGLHFANGVQLSRKEDFVVVCETMRSRLHKYHLQGPKKGLKEVFIEGLPGFPDNVRSNGKGGFYISLVLPNTEETPSPIAKLLPAPSIRKLVLRIQFMLLKFLEILDEYVPNSVISVTHEFVAHLGPFGDPLKQPARQVIIVDVDEAGNIIGSLHNKKSPIAFISEISLGDKYTYFGTPYTDKLWRIKTDRLA